MNRKPGTGDKYYDALKDDSEFQKMMILEKFLYKIDARMFQIGMSRSALAKKMHLNRARVSQILNNTAEQNPTIATLIDLALAVGYQLSDIDLEFLKEENSIGADNIIESDELKQWNQKSPVRIKNYIKIQFNFSKSISCHIDTPDNQSENNPLAIAV